MVVIKVDSLPKGYTILFNGITDALTALSEQNFGTAEAILIQAQQRAEGAYLEDGEYIRAGQKPRPEAFL